MPMLEFDLPKSEQSIIKVIGVGGGGSNAVNHMFKQGIIGVDFAVCNTDQQALDLSPIPVKIQLGPGLTEGRGAGSKPEVGKHACLESFDDVQMFLSNGTKMLFITAGMGGGTGTGAAPIIAKAAKELGILTVAIVTLPFKFEGHIREKHAKEGLDELKRNVDSLIIISNDKLREIHGNLAISEAFGQADDILTTAAKGIAEIITVPGYINVDFEDVNTVMRESGVAIMGSSSAEGEDRAKRAVDAALNSPLLEDNNISGARNILLNITSGTQEVTMDEITTINEFVQSEAGLKTNIIWGNCYDDSLGKKISVTIIASGFEPNKSNYFIEKDKVEVLDLDDDRYSGRFSFSSFDEKTNSNKPLHENKSDLRSTAERYANSQNTEPFINADQNNKNDHPRNTNESSYSNQNSRKNQGNIRLSNPENLMYVENVPAFVRRKVALEELPHSSETNYSRWSINENDELVIRDENPFLRDIPD